MGTLKGNRNPGYTLKALPSATIDDLIAGLKVLNDDLADWLEEHIQTSDDRAILGAFAILSQNISRIGRLIHTRQLLQQPNSLDWFDDALKAITIEVRNAIADCTANHTYA